MKRSTLLFTLLIALSVLLSACGERRRLSQKKLLPLRPPTQP